jgi:hypothetical protein
MGKLVGGPFGMLHGRVGNLVAYVLNGENIMRKIGKSSKPLTPARRANCEKMTVVNHFLQPALPFIKLGFRFEAAGTNRNAYNEAVSYNKMNALQGEYPNISIDYSKILLSKGDLPAAKEVQIEKTENGIAFTWDTSDISSQRQHDRTMLLVSFPELGVLSYHPSGSKRIEGKDLLYFDQDYKDEHMEVYISFVNAEGTQVSDSVHAGTIEAVEAKFLEIEAEGQLSIVVEATVKEAISVVSEVQPNHIRPIVPNLNTVPERNRLWFLEALKNRTAPS